MQAAATRQRVIIGDEEIDILIGGAILKIAHEIIVGGKHPLDLRIEDRLLPTPIANLHRHLISGARAGFTVA